MSVLTIHLNVKHQANHRPFQRYFSISVQSRLHKHMGGGRHEWKYRKPPQKEPC